MRCGWVIFFLISIVVVVAAYSRVKDSHQFSQNECNKCHVDVEGDAGRLKPISSTLCLSCHEDRKQNPHPMDISPETSVPVDMPLEKGKLTCTTCHFVHSFSIKSPEFNFFLLRRPGKGAAFCSACHKIDTRGHIMFENVHIGSYQVTDWSGILDDYSLQCIECHDKYFRMPKDSVGSGTWQHASSNLNHPVGVHYIESLSGRAREFNPQSLLPKEIRLFNGKIGCGTCHNVYSKEKSMLVMSNSRSRLCLTCHIK